MKRLFTFLAIAVAVTMSTGVSRADLLSGCGTCQGSTYLLQYNASNTTIVGADHVYDVFLTIDTSGYSAGGLFLDTVAIKIASSEDTANSGLVAAPGGTGAWAVQGGGLNSGGCNGSGSGFLCAMDGHSAPTPNATPYTWEFHYATTTAISTGTLGSTIKARYIDGATPPNKVGALVSEDITLQACGGTSGETCGGGGGGGGKVPEPGTIILLGSGLVITFAKLRKKLVRS